MTSDRVPDDIVRRIQSEETPTDPCGPHCHQGAIIEALVEDVKGLRWDARERHRVVLERLSELSGAVGDLQHLVSQLAITAARTAQTAADASETANHAALSAAEASRLAPRDSVAPSGRHGLPRRTRGLLYALGVVLAGAGTTLATRCVEAHSPTPVPAAQQDHGGQ